nr:PREDICTED: prolyl 4-hydroxylase subunit alpha-1 [Bemisia tabaci]XP_018912415.1 PREDICTED: prolyl 4-hydroxylase subunit alpha-1 [Bemisia tabaci]
MWIPVLISLLLFEFARAELYTAITDLEDLLESEAFLVRTLHSNIAAEEAKLDALRRQAKLFEEVQNEAKRDISSFLLNPINAYLLVKRMTVDWKQTEMIMQENLYDNVLANFTFFKEQFKFPSDEDLRGAAEALIRLQDTYKLDTSSVARGELNGIQYSSALSASDCFELGRQSYNKQDYVHTSLWMKEALKKYEQEKNQTTTQKWEILEYLAYSTYMEGNVHGALQLTDELLRLFPNHQKALGNRAYYLAAISKEEEESRKQQDVASASQETNVQNDEVAVADSAENSESTTTDTSKESKGSYISDRAFYEALCRKEVTLSPEYEAKLKCHYVSHNNPYLLIGPLKEEEAYLDPRIVLYREVISDSEIEVIKKMSIPRLRRATVQNYKTGALETANYRISKSAWLKDHEDEVIERISKRVEDMTGLTTSTAEELQVVNYGIGGHYEPHFDFARPSEANAFSSLGTGNRIATVLFYMSDVAEGGGTVFPRLNLALWPKKGTAAVWMNLHASCNGDYRTRHAACPVLIGSKWVCNKWLHVVGQEFRRPCVPNEFQSVDQDYN